MKSIVLSLTATVALLYPLSGCSAGPEAGAPLDDVGRSQSPLTAFEPPALSSAAPAPSGAFPWQSIGKAGRAWKKGSGHHKKRETTGLDDNACQDALPGTDAPSGVLQKPKIVYVNWQNAVPQYVDEAMPSFYQDVMNSGYIQWLDQTYGTTAGTYALENRLNPIYYKCTGAGCVVTNDDVVAELQALEGAGFSIPTTLFMVHLPPGYALVDGDGDQQCAYHDFYDAEGGLRVPFAVMSDFSPGSFCDTNKYAHPANTTYLDDVIFAASHELIEAYVDPYDTDYEIGDPCDCKARETGGIPWLTFQGSTHAWFAQQPWDRVSQQCLGQLPNQPPALPNPRSGSGSTVARTAFTMDEFASGRDNTITQVSWSGIPVGLPGPSRWHGSLIPSVGPMPIGGPISATAQDANHVDIFYVGTDGSLYQNSWVVTGQWSAKKLIAGPNLAPAGAQISSLSRAPGSFDVFLVDVSGNLQWFTSSGGSWTHQAIVGSLTPGGAVTAVARTSVNLDVFFVAKDGSVQTAYFKSPNPTWGLLTLADAPASFPGDMIGVTARTWDNLDVFFSQGTTISELKWGADFGWGKINTSFAVGVGTAISAVSLDTTTLEGLFTDSSGAVQDVQWAIGASGFSEFNLQSNTTNAVLAAGTHVSTVTRSPNSFDTFEMGSGTVTIGGVPLTARELVTEANVSGQTTTASVNWVFPQNQQAIPIGGALRSIFQGAHFFTHLGVGSDGVLYVRGTWNGSQVGPTALTAANFAPPGAAVAYAQQSSAQADAFFVGNDGKVYMTDEVNNAAWQAPTALTAANFATPGAALTAGTFNGQLGVFVIDNTGALRVIWWKLLGGWGQPTAVTSASYLPVNAALSSGLRANGELDVFSVDATGVLKYMSFNNIWSGPYTLTSANFAPPGAPTATALDVHGFLNVFTVGNDGALYTKWDATPLWSGPTALTSAGVLPLGGMVSAVTYGNHSIDAFYVGSTGAVDVLSNSGFGWTGPTAITNANVALPGNATSAATDGTELDVYTVGITGIVKSVTTNGTTWATPVLVN